MLGHRHEIPQLQSDMYRKSYHKMLKGLITMILIILFLILAIIYFELFAPKAKYYASTTSGQIIELHAAGS